MTLTLFLEGAGVRGCLRDTDNTTHETEGGSRAGALRSIRGQGVGLRQAGLNSIYPPLCRGIGSLDSDAHPLHVTQRD